MTVNLVQYIYIFNTLIVGGIGLLINYIEIYLPVSLRKGYRFGKFALKEHHAFVAKCEVPKRWYKHFYLFAGAISIIVLCLVLHKYLTNENVPEIVSIVLDILYGSSRKPLVSARNTILAAILINVHCLKKMYESHCVNVFSNQKIHVLHYVAGYIHYFLTVISVISESEGFARGFHTTSSHQITTITFVYAFIFLYFWYLQLKTNFILANLRKNEVGVVTTYDYKIPVGGLFEFITSPLQFTEIMTYVMLSMILWDASTFHYITIFVLVNQAECAYLSYEWYRSTFKDYPKARKILIPYIW